MMKPRGQTEHDEGMLEFLEDIIGSSRLKEPIEELNKRVDQLSDARGEKVCLFRHTHTRARAHTHTHVNTYTLEAKWLKEVVPMVPTTSLLMCVLVLSAESSQGG